MYLLCTSNYVILNGFQLYHYIRLEFTRQKLSQTAANFQHVSSYFQSNTFVTIVTPEFLAPYVNQYLHLALMVKMLNDTQCILPAQVMWCDQPDWLATRTTWALAQQSFVETPFNKHLQTNGHLNLMPNEMATYADRYLSLKNCYCIP